MKTLHSGRNLILKELDSETLVLDVKADGKLTQQQMRRLDRVMSLAGEDTWYGEPSRHTEIEALVKQIDSPKETWTSVAERKRAEQQRMGGR